MIGSYRVRVRNKRNAYDFTLYRNITILCGDSGRGKTTLYDMISEYGRLGKNSGVSISCARPILAISEEDWERKIEQAQQSILVIDEDSAFLRSRDFATAIQRSTNYFLLITRNYLSQLPYSITEIYQIQGNKNKKFVPVYSGVDNIYDHPASSLLPFSPELIITEDSRAGYQFFKNVAAEHGMKCVSAGGKSNIFPLLQQFRDRKVVVIADGAAFGPDIRNIAEEQKLRPGKLAIFLPESFEWIILSSGVAGQDGYSYIAHPQVDSSRYISWERYFTAVLEQQTSDSPYMKYTKEKLPAYYLQDRVKQEICNSIKGLSL